jgi:putative tricarboxylic transport membrane protein
MAILIAFESRTFTVGFVTDPLGPKAFPMVSALLLLLGGIALQFRPSLESNWPSSSRLLRVGVAAVYLLVYALLLGYIGFFTATLLVVAAFAVLLGGRPLPALMAGAICAALLYVLFFYLLDIALPLGSLFVLGN